ncbi:MAG TPA: translocation/assembly module TamB domain-containing protein, partial [Vicinamibacterales bacterium]|nr:translocation/assembly module TamB domain-containing protein [Vicinamibacterales bacterium]
ILTAAFAADPSRVAVETFGFSLAPNSASGQLLVDLDAGTLRGALTADLPRLSPLMAMLPPESRVEGAATFSADIGGTLAAPAAHLVAAARDLALAGQRIDRVDLEARLAGQVLAIERFDVAQGPGRLGVTARYGLDDGRYTFAATGRGLAVQPVVTTGEPLPVEAHFDLDLSGDGTLDTPAGRGTITVRDLTWGAYALGAARIETTVADQQVTMTAAMPALQTTLDLSAALAGARTFAVALAMGNTDLNALLRPAGPGGAPGAGEIATPSLPLTGAVSADVTARGSLDRPADAVVDLALRLLDVTAGGAPIRLDRPAKLRYEAGRLVAEDVSLHTGGMTLTALGRFGDASDTEGLTATLKGGLADLLPFAHLVEGLEGLEASGTVDLTVRAGGALDAPRVEASLAVVDVSASVPDVPPVTAVQLRAAFADGLLTLSELGAAWQGATISATGAVPVTLLGESLPAGYVGTLPALPDRATATIRLDGATQSMAAPFVDPATLAQLEAALAATVTVEATSLAPESVTAAITFDTAELLLAGEPLKQDRPTRLTVANGQLDILDWTWSGKANSLAIAGSARLLGDRPEVNASLAGTLDLRMLGVASPDVAAGGRADFDIRAVGALDDPAIDGEITFRDGELAMRDPRLAVTNLVGVIALAKDRIRFVDFRAAANGGTLTLGGEVALDAFVPVGGAIEIQGRGLAVEMPENLRSEVDLDLTLTVDTENPELSGKVTVLRGSYTQPVSLARQLVAGVTMAAVPVEPSALDNMRFNIDVVSQDGIIVDNNYGKLELQTDVKVVGTYLLPVLAGRMTITEGGAVILGGQTWALERGTVDFTSATEILPNLDLSLVTRVQQYDIRLAVTGTPDTLEANLSSPDGISQADAVSLLLTGKVADRQSVAQSEIARGQLLLLLSGELLGFAGRAVGLDSAQVGRGLGSAGSSFDLLATDSDPSTRLTVSKQLRRDVELVFSRSLRNSNDVTWIAIYRPLKAIELRATTLDDNGRSYEFRNEVNFGGGGDATRTRTARPPAPRVSAVRWTGAAGFPEDELRGRVKLEEGDRFDFYRWQQDRDRLAEWYHERGYLEARIRATRATVPAAAAADAAPTVELTYAIERGPATSIVVEGVSLPGSVLADMREAWATALFDGFLRDDVAALATRSLAGDGYLQAKATVVIREDAAAGTKQVALSVAPGPKYGERRIVFDGQQTLSAGELSNVVEAQRLTLTAWQRPSELETALTAHYRSLGFEQAAVSVGAPVFADSTATLPVTIREGPQFQVASVDITGVASGSLERVRKAFGIEAGTPYMPSALEAARRQVEVDYLQAGYNDVRVTVTSTADVERPATHITLAVQERAQQVLADVAVTGTTATTRGTVETALDLTRGEPASLSDTYRAQKRLYDTGIFRRADVDLVPIGEVAADGTQPVRAVVTLAEVPKYRLRYGVRLIDDLGPLEGNREIRPGLVVDFLRRNLFGRALSAGLAGQLERDRRLARGLLSTPQLFGLPLTTNLFLTRSRQDFTAPGTLPFVRDGSELVAEQRFSPRSNMAVAYNYRFLRTHVFQTDLAPDDVAFDLQV